MSRAISMDYDIAKELGLAAALVYNELQFWGTKGNRRKDGWVYKSYDDMVERLPLSAQTVRRAYKTLRDARLIETKIMRIDGAPTMHYKLWKTRPRIYQNGRNESTKMVDSIETTKMVDSTIYTVKYPLIDTCEFKKTKKQEAVENSAAVRRIYERFLTKFGKAESRYRLSPNRQQKIKARLKDCGEAMIMHAIDNLAESPFHRGDNDRGWAADLDFLLRSYEQVEKWDSAVMGEGTSTTVEDLKNLKIEV